MTTKLVKSTLLSLGMLSAISVSSLLAGGTPAKAQMNQGQTQMNETPNQVNEPATQPELNTSPTPSTTNQNTSPNPSNILSKYSPDTAPIVSYGTQGASVRDIQTVLQQKGLYNGPIDGVYGSQTSSAVKQFQQSANITADGVVGPRTWTAMINAANQSPSS